MRTLVALVFVIAGGSSDARQSADPNDPQLGLYQVTGGVTRISGLPADAAAELIRASGGRYSRRECLEARPATVGGLFYGGCVYTRVDDQGVTVDRAGMCPRPGQTFTDTIEVSGTRGPDSYEYQFRMFRTAPASDVAPIVVETHESGRRIGSC